MPVIARRTNIEDAPEADAAPDHERRTPRMFYDYAESG